MNDDQIGTKNNPLYTSPSSLSLDKEQISPELYQNSSWKQIALECQLTMEQPGQTSFQDLVAFIAQTHPADDEFKRYTMDNDVGSFPVF